MRSEGNRLSSIKVKKVDTYTNLSIKTSSTAQVLKEVHIFLSTIASLERLLFILTNSLVWSFGLPETVGNKIKVTKCFYQRVGTLSM